MQSSPEPTWANRFIILVAAKLYGRLERESERERDWLVANAPDLLAKIRSELERRLGRPEDREHFLGGLMMAGLPIPEA